MKGLLGIYLFRFDGALREKARRRLDTPVPSQAGQTPPNGFPTNLSAPARGLGSVLLQTQSDGDATALDPTTGAADQEVGQAQNLQDLYEDLRDRISQRILELRPGGVPQMAPLEGNPPPQKNTNPALDQVIKRINGPVDRNSVRDHIAALYSLATTRRDDAVTKLYFLLAGDTYADATSAGLFVFRSRRLNIAHRVAMSIVTLADLREVLDAIRAA